MSYRKTFVEVNLVNVKQNVSKIINKFDNYEYYFGVVKADCYGHNGIEVVKSIIEGGCNYLAVATLDEALAIREEIKEIPILCLGASDYEAVDLYIENNITMTVSSIEQLNRILGYKNLKVHIKLNTGMNRLGISKKEELVQVYNKLVEDNTEVEGIYTHIYEAETQELYQKQVEKFKDLIKEIDIKNIPIIHVSASESIVRYEKESFINGCRLGMIMYGFTSDKDLNLMSTFSLYSEIIQINSLKKGDTLGYSGMYKAEEECLIGVVPIGYADGIIRKNTGRCVFINNKEYNIVGNICMDMLFIKIDDSVKVHDKVELLRDNAHIEKVAKHLETIEYEVLCSVGKRVPRKYI